MGETQAGRKRQPGSTNVSFPTAESLKLLTLKLCGQATLEEWLVLQRTWGYISSIFAAPDIQKQLPGEARSFRWEKKHTSYLVIDTASTE